MSKYHKDWLREYIYYTSGHEIPTLYHKWIGLGLIASVLKQNVWIDMRGLKLYPNIFVVLVDYAGAGKSHAIEKFGLELIECADGQSKEEDKVSIYNHKVTSAAMIRSMSKLYKEKGIHCVTIFAEELGFFTDMSGENTNISGVLTKTYDNAYRLGSETIARSLEDIPHPQINMIGGTTPDSLKSSIAKRFISDGVMSRIMFIHSEEIPMPRPFPSPPSDNQGRKEYLAKKLNEFKKLRGQFQWTPEAVECYENWYCDTFNKKTAREDKIVTKRLSGKMLKLALLISVAREHDMIIHEADLLTAIEIYQEAINNYHYIHARLGINELGDKTQKVLDKIRDAKKIQHSKLMSSVRYWCSGNELKNIIGTLEESELIEVRRIKEVKKPKTTYVYRGN